jgi:hypothetical protein
VDEGAGVDEVEVEVGATVEVGTAVAVGTLVDVGAGGVVAMTGAVGAVVGTVVAVDVGTEVVPSPTPAPTNFATSPQRSVTVKFTTCWVFGTVLSKLNDQEATEGLRSITDGTPSGTPFTSSVALVADWKLTRVSLSPPGTIACASSVMTIVLGSPRYFSVTRELTRTSGGQAALADVGAAAPEPRSAAKQIDTATRAQIDFISNPLQGPEERGAADIPELR